MTIDDKNPRPRWNAEDALDRVHARIATAEAADDRSAPRFRAPIVARRIVGWVATATVAAAATVFWFAGRPRAAENDLRAATTGVGERVSIHLSDSSLIWLGPTSTVRYRLTDRVRELTLDGSASFRITHDARRPLIVHARNAQATDLGTEFAVRAYRDDSAVVVSVQSGSVALTGVSSSNVVDLKPGDLGRVDGAGNVTITHNADVNRRAAWVDGQLAFTDQSLGEVVRELERWFDVHIAVSDSALAGRRISAVYSDASLAGVLDALCATLDARREQVGRNVTIRPVRR